MHGEVVSVLVPSNMHRLYQQYDLHATQGIANVCTAHKKPNSFGQVEFKVSSTEHPLEYGPQMTKPAKALTENNQAPQRTIHKSLLPRVWFHRCPKQVLEFENQKIDSSNH